VRLLAVTAATLVLAGLVAAPASAAFPGGDGLLAVQPARGPGVLLVDASTGRQRRLCAGHSPCAIARRPRWSSDGRSLALSPNGRGRVSLVYPDGSCQDCAAIGGTDAAFTADPAVVGVITGGRLREYGSDGIRESGFIATGISAAVWSAAGRLAVARGGRVWTGRPGRLRPLGVGSDPSWSPGGAWLAIVRRGWITLVGVRSERARRLVRGTAPAWSPNGTSVAFIAPGGALSIAAVSSGRARRVGQVRGAAVDWQPIPVQSPAGCVAPPGSTTIASSSTAVVSRRSILAPGAPVASQAYMGCLASTGRERFLQRFTFETIDDATSVSDAAVGGGFAGLVAYQRDMHYGGSGYSVSVFDLRTGTVVPRLGGQQVVCGDYSYSCDSSLDGLVVAADGASAVHTSIVQLGTGNAASQAEQIVASDAAGIHVLDSATSISTNAQLPPIVLTGLALTDTSLSWQHGGAPQSATLH
jgi:hypothetical protein